MLSALTGGECIIHNLSTGEDVESTRYCLSQCGISSTKSYGEVRVKGGKFTQPQRPLYCGNSGTTMRLLAGLLAGQGISTKFKGDSSLSKRPMNRIIDPLTQMGVHFKSDAGCLPITMMANSLVGISYCPPVASAQVKSAILFAALGAEGKTIIIEKIKTRDHTEIMLKEMGVDIQVNDKITVGELDHPLDEFEITIPGDPSSAAFFAVLTAILPNSDITINNIIANPTRTGIFRILKKMGAGVEWHNMRTYFGELVGDLRIYSQPLNGIDITEELVPSVIDELPAIAILASQAESPTSVSGAAELRVKESDRVTAICSNLSKMGCEVVEKQDGFIIYPGNSMYNTNINTFGDHRIAMAFTIAGYITPERNIIDDIGCINISFPEFNSILESIIK
jgi:3-phosphoshikimate 1-carboxyvinyltransferase